MDRKQVPPEERAAISAEISRLLDERDASGRKRWSQASLGTACGGLSQEAIRRAASSPDGVGPAVRSGILKLVGKPIERLIADHVHLAGEAPADGAASVDSVAPAPVARDFGVPTDTLAMAEEAARDLEALDKIDPSRAWEVMRGIRLSKPDASGFYREARRRLGSEDGTVAGPPDAVAEIGRRPGPDSAKERSSSADMFAAQEASEARIGKAIRRQKR
jgi:hypothetical protein